MSRNNKKDHNELVFRPLEVQVINDNFEDAFRRFKTLVQNEGVVAAYKDRQHYEKPSEKKRRKRREAEERRLLLESREVQMVNGEWEKKQKRKEAKRLLKAEQRRKGAHDQG